MQALSLLHLLVALTLLALLPTSCLSANASFPSYSSYAGKPYTVSYDARSLRLNDEPALFVSGSIHYPRSTPGMWPGLMRAAAADGLNMIEIYVFWNYHEPVEGQFDWSDRGNLTLFLDAVAQAGLFANLRIGPLAYKEGVRFRSYNQVWRDHVQAWVGRVIEHTRSYFADHGGPIVLAQIENELNGADARYVQWNGDMANAFNVNVPWLMCNGESANNTINACNGNDCTGFIMSNGQSGRILKDQPALWTENEGWFESWGDVTYPVEGPFSERQPEDISYAIARWFARGGSHMNYYMYHGGNHYDRTAAGGLANKYADGVNFHSDGLPNEPKKSHLMQLHRSIATVAPEVLSFPAQYNRSVTLMWRSNATGPWQTGAQQIAFVYGGTVFVENTANIHLQALYEGMALDMAGNSMLILYRGNVLHNTSAVESVAVERVNTPVWDAPLQWQAWQEGGYSSPPSAALAGGIPTVTATTPQDQLNITRDLTDYLWYSSTRYVQTGEDNATLAVDSGSANAFLIFWDAAYVGDCYNYDHAWTTNKWQCRVPLGRTTAGTHSLSLLSISLGIENGMDPEEVPYLDHFKGVAAGGQVRTAATDFTSGAWVHRPYLTGEFLALYTAEGWGSVPWTSQWKGLVGRPLVWWTAAIPSFDVPTTGQWSLLVDLRGLGRGHFYVNGHDGGRYWLVQGKGSQYPTQWLYHVPQDWLLGADNRITIIEELGGDPSQVQFVISQMRSTDGAEAVGATVEAVKVSAE